MSVHKSPAGTWRAKVRDRTGRQVTKTFKLRADALAWERSQILARDVGGDLVSRKHLQVWVGEWLDFSRNLAPSTVKTYRRDLDRYVLPVLGDYRIDLITTEDIDELLADLLARGYAPSSVHRVYRTLRRLLQVAVDRQKIPANPADQVQPPRIPQREMRFLTVDELELFADTITDRYRSWVLLAGYGGLRWGELLGLRPEDINGTQVNVQYQRVPGPDGHTLEPLKTKASRRTVTVPGSVAEELGYHLDKYATDFVFVNQNGGPISHASFTGNVFKPALVKARLDRQLRIHDLRHTAVAIAIAAGAHPKAIQRRMGHASISVTLDTYGHMMPEMDAGLAGDIDALRRGTLDTNGG